MPNGTCLGIASQDKFLDINLLSASIAQALKESLNITLLTNHSVENVTRGEDGLFHAICRRSNGSQVEIVSHQMVNAAWSNATKLDNMLASDVSIEGHVINEQLMRLKAVVVVSLPANYNLGESKVILGKNGMTIIPLVGNLAAIVGGDNDSVASVYTKDGEPQEWSKALSSNITPANIAAYEEESGLPLAKTADGVLARAIKTFSLPEGTTFQQLVLGTIATENTDINQRRTDGLRPISHHVPGYHSAITGKLMNGPVIALQVTQEAVRDHCLINRLEVPSEFRQSLEGFVRSIIAERQETRDFSVRPLQGPFLAECFATEHTRINSGALGEVIGRAADAFERHGLGAIPTNGVFPGPHPVTMTNKEGPVERGRT